MNKFIKYLLVILFVPIISSAQQQYELRGKIVDYTNNQPLQAVTVMTSSGKWFISDSLGRYNIAVSKGDSVWFTYINKKTQKYIVDTIHNINDFDIALHVDIAWLPTVTVKNRSYLLDSLQRRKDYAKIFNYKKPGLSVITNPASAYVPGGLTSGFDVNSIINAFRVKKMRSIEALQNRLHQEEDNAYIDKRFSKRFVKQLTKLDGEQLDDFRDKYRPSREFLDTINDLELGIYIEDSFKDYLKRTQKAYNPIYF